MTARIVVTGNAATAPQVRVTHTGRKVANFRIASTERRQDKESGDWVDGNRFFVGVACWGALADNVEASVHLGIPLVVTGKISQRSYTDANDKLQFSYEIQADSVAPDLNRGVAEFTRVSRHNGPSPALDEDGLPPFGVSEDPFQGADDVSPRLSAGADTYTVHDDGSFHPAAGHSQARVEQDEPAELAGAAR